MRMSEAARSLFREQGRLQMPVNRRTFQRIRCFLSATTAKGEGIIDELIVNALKVVPN